MHQFLLRLVLYSRPCWSSSQRSPRPLAGFKGPISKMREGGKMRGGEKGEEIKEKGVGGGETGEEREAEG